MAFVSLVTLCAALVLAAEAGRRPAASTVLERLAGSLFVGGLGLLGLGLPLYR